jgi:hypothetical protein
MAFRADDAARAGYQEAEDYLIGRLHGVDDDEREHSKSVLLDIVDELGPVVDSYPSWHPLVSNYINDHSPATTPGEDCGYAGLDHTRYFRNGFISCPYGDGADKIIESVSELPMGHAARITAHKLDAKFYSTNATPVLVKCEWERRHPADGLIPLSIALPLLLEKEVPCWRWSQVAETWDSMHSYFLGAPRGARSSLFVSQETGQALKKVWELLINTGMFGNIKVDRLPR